MNELTRAINLARHTRISPSSAAAHDMTLRHAHERADWLAKERELRAQINTLRTERDFYHAELAKARMTILRHEDVIASAEAARKLAEAAENPKPAAIAIGLRHNALKAIIEAVSARTGVSVAGIMSDSRVPKITRARQIVYFIAQERTSLSFTQIGKRLGLATHHSVVHGIFRVKERIEAGDEQTIADLASIRAMIEPSSTGEKPTNDSSTSHRDGVHAAPAAE